MFGLQKQSFIYFTRVVIVPPLFPDSDFESTSTLFVDLRAVFRYKVVRSCVFQKPYQRNNHVSINNRIYICSTEYADNTQEYKTAIVRNLVDTSGLKNRSKTIIWRCFANMFAMAPPRWLKPRRCVGVNMKTAFNEVGYVYLFTQALQMNLLLSIEKDSFCLISALSSLFKYHKLRTFPQKWIPNSNVIPDKQIQIKQDFHWKKSILLQ